MADAGAAGLRVHVETPDAIGAVANLLARYGKGQARGPLWFCVTDAERGQEYDIDTGQHYAITPQVKGAVKSLEGVVLVEEL